MILCGLAGLSNSSCSTRTNWNIPDHRRLLRHRTGAHRGIALGGQALGSLVEGRALAGCVPFWRVRYSARVAHGLLPRGVRASLEGGVIAQLGWSLPGSSYDHSPAMPGSSSPRSIRKIVWSSTLAPLAMSSGWVNSCGEWLIPSTLGTKITPVGAIRAISCAS